MYDAGEIEQVIGIAELTRMGLDKYQYCAQQRKNREIVASCYRYGTIKLVESSENNREVYEVPVFFLD